MKMVPLVAFALALLGCGDSSAPQIAVILQASPTSAAVGDTITFTAQASASALANVKITYGDNLSDIVQTNGLAYVLATFKHVYAASGTYKVETTATDTKGGSRGASFTVSIQ